MPPLLNHDLVSQLVVRLPRMLADFVTAERDRLVQERGTLVSQSDVIREMLFREMRRQSSEGGKS